MLAFGWVAQFSRAGTSGGVVEWLMAPVLKTGRAQALVGSNPTPSAGRRLRVRTAGASNFAGGDTRRYIYELCGWGHPPLHFGVGIGGAIHFVAGFDAKGIVEREYERAPAAREIRFKCRTGQARRGLPKSGRSAVSRPISGR